MILSRRSLVVLLLGLCPALFAASAKKSKIVDDATAFKGAIVIDAATGKVLFEDRADVIAPPASMTKLMTFAVLYDKIAAGALTLATPVRIVNADMKMAGTQVWLDPRETFPVEELIYAMMIQSANDAAHALARTAGGSREAFVELMNAKARELGMKNTTFRTPHGLPPENRKVTDGDLTTPRDFALLCRHLIQKTDVLKYASVEKRDFAPNRPKGPLHMVNHNKLLGKVSGVDGLKTGFTDSAGYCLSATAQRNGRRVILVIMGSLGPGGQKDLGRSRDAKAVELIERGFAALPAAPAPAAPIASVSNPSGTPNPAPASGTPNATPAAEAPLLRPAPLPAQPAPAAEPPVKLNIPKKQ